MFSSCSIQSEKGVGIRAEFKFDKANVPVFRRDLSRIKASRSAWERARKDRVRAALMPGREASITMGNPARDSSGDVSGTSVP
eukprot:1147689-Pelagomonas_calceolata.AAC.5